MKKKRRASRKQEKQIMERVGGRVQPASGATPYAKGDVRLYDVYRIEAKYTQSNYYKLDIRDLFKIAGECQGNERPLFIIDFKEKRTLQLRKRFVVMQFEDWEKLQNAATNN